MLSKEKLSLPILGICKEVEKADGDHTLGIVDFEKKYFCGPMYQDPKLAFYSFLGNNKLRVPLSKMLNPMAAWRDLKAMGARMKDKKVEGNYKGEGFLQGGVLVIGKDDSVVYSYREQTGSGIPPDVADEIAKAARSLR